MFRRLRLLLEELMAAIDDLNTAIGNLNTAVDAAVAKLGTPPDESAITTATTEVQAAADKLNAAVNPPA